MRTRGRLGWFALLVLTGLTLAFVQFGLTPWAARVGGRSTPLGEWTGYGQVEATNGGRYVLFTHLEAGMLFGTKGTGRRGGGGGFGGIDDLQGTAKLCTESGVTYTFDLAGKVKAWWSTDGASTKIRLTHGSPARLPSGWDVAFHGAWRGPELELSSPDNSFTEVFTPRGEIRKVTSTADAGTARVTLRYGSEAEFAAACSTLK
jgi:hypothetical protein